MPLFSSVMGSILQVIDKFPDNETVIQTLCASCCSSAPGSARLTRASEGESARRWRPSENRCLGHVPLFAGLFPRRIFGSSAGRSPLLGDLRISAKPVMWSKSKETTLSCRLDCSRFGASPVLKHRPLLLRRPGLARPAPCSMARSTGTLGSVGFWNYQKLYKCHSVSRRSHRARVGLCTSSG